VVDAIESIYCFSTAGTGQSEQGGIGANHFFSVRRVNLFRRQNIAGTMLPSQGSGKATRNTDINITIPNHFRGFRPGSSAADPGKEYD
jgi:hypothetical protein